MEHRKKVKHKRKKSLIRRISHKIKRKISSLFEGSAPKEFRPYLGPNASDDEIEQHKFENTRANPKVYHKKKKSKKRKQFNWFGLADLSETLEKKRAKRKKEKYKRKAKKKKRRKDRQRKRVEFIRRFLPQYKQESSNVVLEFAQSEDLEEKDSKAKHTNNFIYTLNSTVLFLIAYLVVYFLYQITVLVVASRWKIDSVLFYYDLAFNDYSPLWNRLNIIMVTISGPVMALIIGILFLRLFAKRIHARKHLKLFFIWLGIHGYNLFLGAWASGISFDEGFGYVPAWLFLNVFWQIFLAMVFLFVLGAIGYYSASAFLDTSFSPSRIKQKNKVKFLFYQAVLPWLIGATIVLLVKIPNNLPYDVGNLVTLLFAMVPVVFHRSAKPSKNFKSLKKPNRINWIILGVMIALYAAFRIGLDSGLHVVLNYKFIFDLNINPL